MESEETQTALDIRRPVVAHGLWARPTAGYRWEGVWSLSRRTFEHYGQPIFANRLGRSSLVYDARRAVDSEDANGPLLCEPHLVAENAWVEYDPVRETDLVKSFLKIGGVPASQSFQPVKDFPSQGRNIEERSIKRFADRFGLLGFRLLNVGDQIGGPMGESLTSWREEIHKFRCLHDLCIAMKDKSNEGAENLARLYDRILVSGSDYHPGIRLRDFVNFDDYLIRADLRAGRGEEPLPIRERASELARDMLNKELDLHVSVRLDVRRAPVALVPHNLIGAIYLQFAVRLNGGALEVRLCKNPECRSPLSEARSNKEFCDSKCKDRYNYLRRTGRIPEGEKH